ncbi:TolC family protein [Formosa algae]|uniref:Outer membrane protein n=1 Tax=Formosa algae TaxID=225843 RepID=A0A9X0YMQ9_9FLAO|nr:TolC family protein [Formosa algae]MBP1840134.1 outer membrane protein [Formosa algae]MDQ0335734.1 outer membrane protein [Formosa algae]OEI79774.1 transporter [Formosa algae]
MIHKIIILIILFFISLISFSQTKEEKQLTLDECIAIALENNLDLKSTHLLEHSAKVNYKQSKADLLPNLNGDFNLGVNDGRSIDPFTNDYIDQELTYSNLGLSIDMTIFNGFRLLNTAKQNRLNSQASELETEAEQQDLILNVTLAYLQVLNAKDVLDLAHARLEATKQQLKIQQGFFESESGNPADYADILGQIANDETSILVSESSLNSAKLSLMLLLNVEERFDVNTEHLFLGFEPYSLSVNEVYKASLENLATYKAKDLRIEAAKKGMRVAKSQFTPEVSLYGGVYTNHSSAAELYTSNGTSVSETGDYVTVNGQDLPVITEQTLFTAEQINYRDQLDNNLNTAVGIAVSVPLFNGFRAKNNVALEKIKVEESIIELERTQVSIKNVINQVYFDMDAAFKRHQSLEKQVVAYQESYRINDIRFKNGVSNFLNYITSKNNLDNAKVNLANAKYEYLLRVKVLDYYRGLY